MDVDVGYSLEFKLNAVKLYLNKYGCYRSVAKEIFVNEVTVKDWVDKYKLGGEDNLKVKRVLYSLEFKQKAIDMILKGKNVRETALELNVSSHSVVKAWYNKYKLTKKLEIDYIELNSKMSKKKKLDKTKIEISDKDMELKKLQRENELLRMELDVIKKLEALVQKREKSIK